MYRVLEIISLFKSNGLLRVFVILFEIVCEVVLLFVFIFLKEWFFLMCFVCKYIIFFYIVYLVIVWESDIGV